MNSFLSTMGWSDIADSVYTIDTQLRGVHGTSWRTNAGSQASRPIAPRSHPACCDAENDFHSIPEHQRCPKIRVFRDSPPLRREFLGKGKTARVYHFRRGGAFYLIPKVGLHSGYSFCNRRISTSMLKWCVGRSKKSWKSFVPCGYPSTTSSTCFPHYDLESSRSRVRHRCAISPEPNRSGN